jgi:hypothetical protein
MSVHPLEALVHVEPGSPEEPALAERICQAVKVLHGEERQQALAALARALAAGGHATRHLTQLAAAPKVMARHLALRLAARLPPPLEPGLIAALRPLLGEQRLSLNLRLKATLALLRTTGKAGPDAVALLEAYVAGESTAKALKQLRQLERRTGRAPAVRELYACLDNQLGPRCPRCDQRLPQPELARHVWEKHQVVLYGRGVREPWRLMDHWIAAYRLQHNPQLLQRCQTLAEWLDPEQGLLRVYRRFLAGGIDHTDARRTLLNEARHRGVSLCPRCYAEVPVTPPTAIRHLTVSRGRLAAPGYHVEVSETGFVSRLEIEAPGAVVWRGREPGRHLTRKGATVLLVGPPVLTALALAVALALWDVPLLVPVLLVLGLALLAAVIVRIRWRPRTDLVDRAVNYAWTMLVPRLHRDGFAARDAEFVAGLALLSTTHGRPEDRVGILEQVLTTTEKAVAAGTGSTAHLALLWRLAVEDALTTGHDAVRWVLTQVGRCFEAKLPLTFAQHFLADWESRSWSRGNLARLRVLLCDRAFEAGLEVCDLVELGVAAPALAEVLYTLDLNCLLQLRLLWSLRPAQPWGRCGQARQVFELAADPHTSRKRLAEWPDLLLEAQEPAGVLLCGRGVVFRGVLFTAPPRTWAIRKKWALLGGGYELIVDTSRFWFPSDPQHVLDRLRSWCHFYFEEFLPKVADAYYWQSRGVMAALRHREAVKCAACQQALVGQVGEVGSPV